MTDTSPVVDAAGHVRWVPPAARRADELAPGLWLGDRTAGGPTDPATYDLTVSCAPGATAPRSGRHLTLPMDDGPTLPDPDRLADTVAAVVAEVEDGGTVLVRCHAGLNRSGLVAVLALAELWRTDTATALEAARELRSPWVLCNPAFERHVLSVPRDTQEPEQVPVGRGWRVWSQTPDGALRPAFQESYQSVPWRDGVNVATCVRSTLPPGHAPTAGCVCGIYVCGSLEELAEYVDHCRVAVRPGGVLMAGEIDYGGAVFPGDNGSLRAEWAVRVSGLRPVPRPAVRFGPPQAPRFPLEGFGFPGFTLRVELLAELRFE